MQTHGILEGSCILKNGRCLVKLNPEYDGISECKTELITGNASIRAIFNQCNELNLPDDFSGNYTKVTSLITGDYVVTAEKSYFYAERNEATQRKAYLLQGDKMDVQIIYDNTWGYALFTNAKGQVTAGYLKLATLRMNR